MTELLLLSLVPVVAALVIGFGVAASIRRSIPVEPVTMRAPDTPDPRPLPRGRAATPDAAGANRVSADDRAHE